MGAREPPPPADPPVGVAAAASPRALTRAASAGSVDEPVVPISAALLGSDPNTTTKNIDMATTACVAARLRKWAMGYSARTDTDSTRLLGRRISRDRGLSSDLRWTATARRRCVGASDRVTGIGNAEARG